MAVLNITSENYEKEVAASKLPVLLDFWEMCISDRFLHL